MSHFPFIANIGILFSTFLFSQIEAQEISKRSSYIELHTAVQGSFGPSLSQAEIAGGIDTLSFDNKKHLSPGFKTSVAAEFVAGIRRNKFQFQSTLGYYKQDIGLLEKFSQSGDPFFIADLLSVKASALLQLSNTEKRGPNGFYTGFFIGSVFSVSTTLKDEIKINYAVKVIRPYSEIYWGIDYSYIQSFGKKGWYAIAGASITMPGLLGGIGKIEMENNSPYTIIRDKIQMYTVRGFIGIGMRLKCKPDSK